MEIENTEQNTVIVFKNNSVFIGVYIVPFFILISMFFSGISIESIIVHFIFFTFLNIGNYIAIKNIGSIETITLNNGSLIIKRLRKNKKITYEKEIFYDEILKIYYQEFFFLGLHKRDFNFDKRRGLKIKTYLSTYSFGYKMSYEEFKKISDLIEERIQEYKNSIEKRKIKKNI